MIANFCMCPIQWTLLMYGNGCQVLPRNVGLGSDECIALLFFLQYVFM